MPAPRNIARASRQDRIVIVLGAGATKACGGPLTVEILPKAFESDKRLRLHHLDEFLVKHFGVPKAGRTPDDYPPLPLLLSLLDTAIDREHAFGGRWSVNDLRTIRKEAEYAVFKAIARGARGGRGADLHRELFTWVSTQTGREPTAISLNYDLLADQALIAMERRGFPNYACQIDTPGYADARRWGKLLKIHGSMNWIYCSACDRLELGIDRSGETYKIALDIARTPARNSHDLQRYYQTRAMSGERRSLETTCTRCGGTFSPVMITPTHLKDYRNPHIAALWFRAERELQECTRVIFIGYSLPWDDVDVIYLLKRGLLRKNGRSPTITVVEHAKRRVPIEKHDVGRRYRAIFGRDIDWQPVGFERWMRQVTKAVSAKAPPGRRLRAAHA